MAAITKYFIGGELEAFVQGSHASTTWTTSGGYYDSDFARGAVYLNTHNSFGYILMPLTAPQTTCWVSFQALYSSNAFTTVHYWSFFNNVGGELLRVIQIGGTPAQPSMQFQYWSGAAWTAIGSGMVVPANARHKWDIQYLAAGSGGILRCYVDGLLMGSLTGNTSFISPAALSEVHLYTTDGGGVDGTVAISEAQVLDVSTLGRRLATLGETANGINTAWTGAYTDINEVGTFNDSNFIQSGTANQVSTFVTSDLSATAQTYNVSGLVIAGRALNGAVGPQNLNGACVIGGTTYITTNNVAGPFGLPTVFGYVWADFPNNPATGVDFTPTEINTAGFETGWKSIT